MSIDPVLLRHPVIGPDGLMTREWIRQQQQASNQITAITQNVTNIQTASGFDDRTPVDYSGSIEDAQNLARDPQRVYDDSELRNALAGLDAPNLGFQQQIDELRALLAAGDPAPFGALGSAAFQATTAFLPANAFVTSYTSTLSPSGAMTITSQSMQTSQYQSDGYKISLNFRWTFAVGGTPANTLTATLPVTPVTAGYCGLSCWVFSGSYWIPAYAEVNNGSSLTVYWPTGGTFLAGANYIALSGFYRIQ